MFHANALLVPIVNHGHPNSDEWGGTLHNAALQFGARDEHKKAPHEI